MLLGDLECVDPASAGCILRGGSCRCIMSLAVALCGEGISWIGGVAGSSIGGSLSLLGTEF